MTEKSILLILGNQLFSIDHIKSLNPDRIFMAEDLGLSTYEKHHKLKILMIFSAMREKRDELVSNSIGVDYTEIEDPDFNLTFEEKLEKSIKKKSCVTCHMTGVKCHMKPGTFHISHATCHMSLTATPTNFPLANSPIINNMLVQDPRTQNRLTKLRTH